MDEEEEEEEEKDFQGRVFHQCRIDSRLAWTCAFSNCEHFGLNDQSSIGDFNSFALFFNCGCLFLVLFSFLKKSDSAAPALSFFPS